MQGKDIDFEEIKQDIKNACTVPSHAVPSLLMVTSQLLKEIEELHSRVETLEDCLRLSPNLK